MADFLLKMIEVNLILQGKRQLYSKWYNLNFHVIIKSFENIASKTVKFTSFLLLEDFSYKTDDCNNKYDFYNVAHIFCVCFFVCLCTHACEHNVKVPVGVCTCTS